MDLGWIGILMIAFSILYLLSLLSFDPNEPRLNSSDSDVGYNNMIGPVGAHLSNISFIAIGFASYMMPLIFLLWAGLHPSIFLLSSKLLEGTCCSGRLHAGPDGVVAVSYTHLTLPTKA